MDCEIIYPENSTDKVLIHSSEIVIIFDKKFDRKSDPYVEQLIEKEKAILAKKQNHVLFNKSKFRLHSIKVRNGKLILNIGLTDYFEYLITNHTSSINRCFIERGLKFFQNPDSFLSNALGNVAIISLKDNKYILVRRNKNVHTFVGYYDLPGGHPEPERINPLNSSSKGIVNELYGSIKREIQEELNISESNIISVFTIGFLRNFEDGRKPEMLFYVPLDLSSDEVSLCFDKIAKKVNEASDIVFIDFHDKDKLNYKVTAVSKATLYLHSKIKRFV